MLTTAQHLSLLLPFSSGARDRDKDKEKEERERRGRELLWLRQSRGEKNPGGGPARRFRVVGTV